MTFTYSPEWTSEKDLQRVLNAGLFYSLIEKKSGRVVSHHYGHEDAKRAKTRKTRVMLTRNLLFKQEINGHEQNESLGLVEQVEGGRV